MRIFIESLKDLKVWCWPFNLSQVSKISFLSKKRPSLTGYRARSRGTLFLPWRPDMYRAIFSLINAVWTTLCDDGEVVNGCKRPFWNSTLTQILPGKYLWLAVLLQTILSIQISIIRLRDTIFLNIRTTLKKSGK